VKTRILLLAIVERGQATLLYRPERLWNSNGPCNDRRFLECIFKNIERSIQNCYCATMKVSQVGKGGLPPLVVR